MATTTSTPKNPRRVQAGSANRRLWTGFTPAGLERLRAAAVRNQPWRFSTGPTTPQGKARVAANSRLRQKGVRSIRQLRAEVADVWGLVAGIAELRRSLVSAREVSR